MNQIDKEVEDLEIKGFYRKFHDLIIEDGAIKIQMVYPVSNCDEANCFGPLLPNFNGKP